MTVTHLFHKTENSVTLRLALISIVLIALSGCETLFGTYSGGKKEEEQRQLITIGDVEQYAPVVKRVKIKNIQAQDVIDTYQSVFEESDDPEMKTESVRRIADLSLIATDDRIAEQSDLVEQIDKLNEESKKISELPATEKEALKQRREKKIASNSELVEKSEARINELDQLNQESYQSAIDIYERILKENPDAEGNDVILYQLAAAYDATGNENKVAASLDQVAEKYPNSAFHTESEFRRAEIYFSIGDYITAAEAYESAMSSKTDIRFAEHSLYKHGWSLFKMSEYELAIEDFVKLRDSLGQKVADAKKRRRKHNTAADEKLINDTNRVIALSFSHLSGPKELQKYFKKIGGRSYELAIYKQLHRNYINQERYRDAAKTYDVFLDTYPTHKEAPQMQSEILQAYQDGGFPSLVLPGKIDYVKRFGIYSDFWKKYVAEDSNERVYTNEEREALLSEVKKHLADVSKHYHSIAQRSKKKKDYTVAATWYREYLDTFSNKDGVDTEETLEIRKLLAESLYESEQYDLAVVEFEKMARASGNNKEAGANASYFALLSYQKMLDAYKGEEEGKNELVAKKVESSQFFIANYRDDERMPNVLGNIIRDQISIKDYEGAVKNSRVLVSLDPPAKLSMQRTAWVTIANAEFDAKDYSNSEKSYQKVLTFEGFSKKQRIKYSQQVANSIYKNAESLKEKGELIPAAEEFLRLGKVMPASRIRAQAHFDAANLYLEAKEWHKAINTLNVFRRLYPKHKLIDTFPDKMAVAYKNTEQHDKAADQYIIIAKRYEKTDKELARQTLWEAAMLKEKAKNDPGARELFRQYANAYKSPLEQNVEAQYRLVQLYEKTENEYRVNFWKDKIIKSHAKAGDENTPRITFLAAKMKFENYEKDFRKYKGIRIKQPLKKSLKKKKDQMNAVLEKYQEIANMGSAEWTTASNFKIAKVYQILGEDLIASERPKGLTADQLEQYDILIEEQAYPFEDQAIEVFIFNTDLVKDGVYDKWVKQSFEALGKLLPGRYAKYEKRAQYVESIY
jgi:TolA-binding protein